jgi:hypothetical protein
MHIRDGEAQPVQDAGAEVLNDYIGPLQQLPQDSPPVVALEVQRDGFLVAVA